MTMHKCKGCGTLFTDKQDLAEHHRLQSHCRDEKAHGAGVDAEIAALGVVVSALDKIAPEKRERVLTAVAVLLDVKL